MFHLSHKFRRVRSEWDTGEKREGGTLFEPVGRRCPGSLDLVLTDDVENRERRSQVMRFVKGNFHGTARICGRNLRKVFPQAFQVTRRIPEMRSPSAILPYPPPCPLGSNKKEVKSALTRDEI